MAFGLHESVPVYSGGLGVLAGDHLKSASDLGLPLTGVGLMFREGYFRQYLNPDGWQQERYPENDFFNLPLVAVTGPDGKPVLVEVPIPGRQRGLRPRPGAALPRPVHGAAGAGPQAVPGPGPGQPRRRGRGVRHDGAGPEAVEHGQRRLAAARRRVAEDVAGRLAGAAGR